MNTPIIPNGWRELKCGETVVAGDMFWYKNKGPWTQVIYDQIGQVLTKHNYPFMRRVSPFQEAPWHNKTGKPTSEISQREIDLVHKLMRLASDSRPDWRFYSMVNELREHTQAAIFDSRYRANWDKSDYELPKNT